MSKSQSSDSARRFANVSCSQCGREFGPGNAGFSHCQDHEATRLPEFNSNPFAWARWSTVGLGPDIMIGSIRPDGEGWFSVHARFDDVPAIPAPEGAQADAMRQALDALTLCRLALGDQDPGDSTGCQKAIVAIRAAMSAPAPQAPVALTDAQVLEVVQRIDPHHQYLPGALRQFARAIEAAHGIPAPKEPKA